MDLANLPAPTFTAVDGITDGIGALIYITIGVAAWLRRPADVRTRVFLAFSLGNLITLGVPAYWWNRGITDPTKLPLAATVVIMVALGIATLSLFHFTQVFPRRRPWIQQSGVQMEVAYVLVPIVVAGLVWFAPPTLDKITTAYVLAFVVFGFPLLVLLGLVLPVGGILSLFRTYREIQESPLAHLKSPLQLILVSQIAGGTLTILFAPVLAVLARDSIGQSALTVIISAVALLTPVAYATAVFKHNVLTVDPD